jgi:translation initiation factor IF-2
MDIDKLSTKERDSLLRALSAKKKQEETAKRKNYQRIRARFISSVEKRLRKYVKDGQTFKRWLRDEAETYYNTLKEYGELKRDEQLGFTVNNDTFRIQVKGNRVKRFDERADIAEKRLIDYLSDWIKQRGDSESNPIYKLAMSLLQRNEYGDLDYKSISRLYELEPDFNDTEYTEIMQLFRESNTVEGTIIRFYFEEKDDMNEWRRIEPSFNQI